MSQKILISGITGFIGRRLALELKRRGNKVCGFGFWRNHDELLDWFDEDILIEEIDICDPVAVDDFILKQTPDFIYHLAAQANINTAKANPNSTFRVNIEGTQNVLSAASGLLHLKGFHLASSSDVYGHVHASNQPITEHCNTGGLNPYAISKIAAERLALCYADKGLINNIFITRLFTCIGPGQYRDAAVSYFAWQAARIRLGLQESVIWHGNIDNYRTWIDVRDVVKAFSLFPTNTQGFHILNLGGEQEVSLRIIVEELAKLCNKPVELKERDSQVRKTDITTQVGDISRFKNLLQWEQTIPLKQTIQDMFQYWLERLSK